MKALNIEWRSEQIAWTILYRCFGNISIERTPERGNVDLLVKLCDGTELQFGVVVRASVLSNDAKDKIVDNIANSDFSQDINRIPIILMVVDEPSESAKIAFLLGWKFGIPRIYKNFELRSLNKKNADICLQLIKSMDNVIRFLSTESLNVLKRITFSRKLRDNRVQHAEILYLRKLSATYRMSQKKVVEEKERFKRLLNGAPEEEYPQDELDNMIFMAVRGLFRNAKVRSHLLLFSTELDDLQRYRDIHCHHTTLVVTPDLSAVPNGALGLFNGLEVFNVPLDVFVENVFYENAFDDISFEKEEPLEGWFRKVIEWNKQKETMRAVSAYFR